MNLNIKVNLNKGQTINQTRLGEFNLAFNTRLECCKKMIIVF